MNMYLDFTFSKLKYLYLKSKYRPIACILMLHRVAYNDKESLKICESLKVSPEYLEQFLINAKKRGYKFISIDELYDSLIRGIKLKKCLVISIDDGYMDTFTTAYPILKSRDIPFVFYLTTSFPDKSAIAWWYVINQLILNNAEIILDNGAILPCGTIQQKESSYITLSKIILRLGNNFANKLPLLFSNYNIDLYGRNEVLFLGWDEVVEMTNSSICTLGSHTVSHFGLRFENNLNVIKDMVNCKIKIKEKTGKNAKHLAFPYGTAYSVGRRESQLAKQAGYLSAVTTYSSPVYMAHKNSIYSLPRMNFIDSRKYDEYLL